MDIAKIKKSNLCGSVTPIASKSFAHRQLIVAGLYGDNTKITNLPNSEDIKATIGCLKCLGVKFNGCDVLGCTSFNNEKVVLDANESGSTLRFFLPIVCAIGGEFEIKGSPRLIERGNALLIELLRANGIEVVETPSSIKVKGKLKCANFKIRGDISSQYISGLLFALPLIEGGGKIEIEGELQSEDYVKMTVETLREFDVKIAVQGNKFEVFEKQNKTKDKEMKVESDFSNGAFFLVLSALQGNLTVKGLNQNSIQGDREILNILTKSGAKIRTEGEGICFENKPTLPLKVECQNIPDLVPILCVLASFIEGRSEFSGVERLKIKESDRILSTTKMLTNFGIECKYENDKIIVEGKVQTKIKSAKICGFNDHRIVMSACVMALCREGEWVITEAKAINKSYPQFFDIIKELGGSADVNF